MNSDNNTKVQTLGEYRVGVDFNPSGSEVVNKIKALAAELIDLCAGMPMVEGTEAGEFKRLTALAMTNIEQAAMWGVKAATKKPQNVDASAGASTVAGGESQNQTTTNEGSEGAADAEKTA